MHHPRQQGREDWRRGPSRSEGMRGDFGRNDYQRIDDDESRRGDRYASEFEGGAESRGGWDRDQQWHGGAQQQYRRDFDDQGRRDFGGQDRGDYGSRGSFGGGYGSQGGDWSGGRQDWDAGSRGGYGRRSEMGNFQGYGGESRFGGQGGQGGYGGGQGGYGQGGQGRGGQGGGNDYGSGYGYGESSGGYGMRDQDYRGSGQDDRAGGSGYGGFGGSQGQRESQYGHGGFGSYGTGEQGRQSQQRRGPKGYTRSDERIKEDVCERLSNRADVDTSDVSIEVHNGKVKLEGTVPERRMRHMVEDIACGCMGVQDVDNNVRVARQDESGQRSGNGHGTTTPSPQTGKTRKDQ